MHPHEAISQGYLLPEGIPGGVEIRVRRKGEDHRFVTIKHGQGLRRTEVELPLSAEDFEALWPLTEGRRIEKVRYRLPTGGVETIELDVYHGALAGLFTAEVEFESEEASRVYESPAYFGREVTDEPAYRNASLARHGLP